MSTKVTPKPKFKLQGVDFTKLSVEDCFLHDDTLCMKISNDIGDGQACVDLMNGEAYQDMCGQLVQPVDVEIKWKRQTKKF